MLQKSYFISLILLGIQLIALLIHMITLILTNMNLSLLVYISFIGSILLTGYLYAKNYNNILPKALRRETAFQCSLIYLIFNITFVLLLHFYAYYLILVIIYAGIYFAIIYFGLAISSKIFLKIFKNPP